MKTSGSTVFVLALGAASILSAQTSQAPQASVSLLPRVRGIVAEEQLLLSREGGIVGVVIDSRRRGIARAELQLRNLQQGAIIRQTVSNDEGRYAFPAVDPGIYIVELQAWGAVIALSETTTLAGGEVVQTLVQVPGRWDPTRRVVEPVVAFSQFIGATAASTMAGRNMTRATILGITAVDPGEPVSGQRIQAR